MTLIMKLSIAVALSIATVAHAEDEILTLTLPDADQQSFSLEDLQQIRQTSFTTSTIWTEGSITFSGVSLEDFLAELDVNEGVILASAINDYTVEIPVTDATEGGPIIAYHMNGQPMSIRDKGPLWIVYPYDSNPDYQAEVIYSRSIWQLDRIKVGE